MVLGLAVLAMLAMWVYVLFLHEDTTSPDRLEDRSFPTNAEPLCGRALARLDQLPPARESTTPQERAEVVDEADEVLRGMVADLRAQAPTAGSDGRIVTEWLGDWGTYVGDRDDWADVLRTGKDTRFFETAKGGGPISELIDRFAVVNDMPSCATPDDV